MRVYPLPGGCFDLQPGKLMASGHIKPLSNHKQLASNTQQGLASNASAGTMREYSVLVSRPRTRLVTGQDSRIGEQYFEHGSDLLIDGEGPIQLSADLLCGVGNAEPLQAPISEVSAT